MNIEYDEWKVNEGLKVAGNLRLVVEESKVSRG